MSLHLSNPLRIHYGPKGTTRLDATADLFNVTLTSPDGDAVISRATRSRYRADQIFADLSGTAEDLRP